MIRKYFFQLIFLYLFFSKEVFAAESGGMPQLDPEFWVSQIFWLTLVFGTLYVVLSKLILPKISANLELRKSQIQENIEAADKQRKDSELKLKEYDDIILKSKLESKNLFNETREKTLKNINIKRDALEKQIDIAGIVGRDGGYTYKNGNYVIKIPCIDDKLITPIVESYQALVWHCIVSDERLKSNPTKW